MRISSLAPILSVSFCMGATLFCLGLTVGRIDNPQYDKESLLKVFKIQSLIALAQFIIVILLVVVGIFL